MKPTSSPKKAAGTRAGHSKQVSRGTSAGDSGRSVAEDYPSGDEEDREGYVGPDKRGRPRTRASAGPRPRA